MMTLTNYLDTLSQSCEALKEGEVLVATAGKSDFVATVTLKFHETPRTLYPAIVVEASKTIHGRFHEDFLPRFDILSQLKGCLFQIEADLDPDSWGLDKLEIHRE